MPENLECEECGLTPLGSKAIEEPIGYDTCPRCGNDTSRLSPTCWPLREGYALIMPRYAGMCPFANARKASASVGRFHGLGRAPLEEPVEVTERR